MLASSFDSLQPAISQTDFSPEELVRFTYQIKLCFETFLIHDTPSFYKIFIYLLF